jgi:hypothetical protein
MPLDVAITYELTRESQATTTGSFFLQGGAVELHANVYAGLGVVASITGEHVSTGTTGAAPIDMVVAAFGPRYTFTPPRRTALFAETLVGEANAFHSVFPGGVWSYRSSRKGHDRLRELLGSPRRRRRGHQCYPAHLSSRRPADWQRTFKINLNITGQSHFKTESKAIEVDTVPSGTLELSAHKKLAKFICACN